MVRGDEGNEKMDDVAADRGSQLQRRWGFEVPGGYQTRVRCRGTAFMARQVEAEG